MPLLDPGKKAPVFALPDQHGAVHQLKSYIGRPVVLYFYPKDESESCTEQACGFSSALTRFNRCDAAVLGVSVGDVASKKKFSDVAAIRIPLLADMKQTVSETYGVWQEKSMYGKKYMGIVRTTYLIDVNGKIAQRWDNVRVDGHVADVLSSVKSLLTQRV